MKHDFFFCKIIAILSCLSAFICEDEQFLEEEVDEVYKHLGNKTPYRIIYDKNGGIDTENAKCAKKIWMLIGHGSTYPSEEDLNTMNKYLPKLKDEIIKAFAHRLSSLTYDKLALFDSWLPIPLEVNDTLKLVREGENEMFHMASRMQTKYPKLFPKEFENTTYQFKYVGEDAIRESARYFALGLFGKQNIRNAYFPKPTDDDLRIISPWRSCLKWNEEIKSNPGASIEKDLFYDGQYISNAVQDIEQYLGISKLTRENVRAMYLGCAYETTWSKNERSPWCTVFTLSNIKVFEYLDDLDLYWLRGYGHQISREQSCLGMKDALLFFNDRRSNRRSCIYFTDPESIASLLAEFGLYKTPVLNHHNFNPNIRRAWRSNKIGGFATNLALILYECKGRKFISLFHNEQFLEIPACRHRHTCDFTEFKKYYEKSVNRCNFDDICETED